MTTLHLGVVEIPYSHEGESKTGKAAIGAETTGDVATFLENRYHVMAHFFELHQGDIAKALENSLGGALESLLMGAPATSNAFASAENEIEALFRKMLTTKELDSLGYPGIPTKASLEGISSRFKRRRGPPRPSFVDT